MGSLQVKPSSVDGGVQRPALCEQPALHLGIVFGLLQGGELPLLCTLCGRHVSVVTTLSRALLRLHGLNVVRDLGLQLPLRYNREARLVAPLEHADVGVDDAGLKVRATHLQQA